MFFCFQVEFEICLFTDERCLFWCWLTHDSFVLYEEHMQLCSNVANGRWWICGDVTVSKAAVLMEDPRFSVMMYFPSDWHVYGGGCRGGRCGKNIMSQLFLDRITIHNTILFHVGLRAFTEQSSQTDFPILFYFIIVLYLWNIRCKLQIIAQIHSDTN